MAAALDIDREAVKTLAIAVGVRQAARQMGLAESTVQAWSNRGDWFVKTVQPPTVLRATNATKTPSEALTSVMTEHCTRARHYLAKTAMNGAKAMSKRPGEVIATVRESQTLRNITDAASKIGGWDADKREGDKIMINIGILGQ